MRELFVCEKPSQAKTLAEALSGSYESKDGYFVGQDERVYTYGGMCSNGTFLRNKH